MMGMLHFQSAISIPKISFKKQLSLHRRTLSWRDSLNVVGFRWFGFVLVFWFGLFFEGFLFGFFLFLFCFLISAHPAGTDFSSQKRAANLAHMSW